MALEPLSWSWALVAEIPSTDALVAIPLKGNEKKKKKSVMPAIGKERAKSDNRGI
jgi:hypothetical protein